MRSARAAGSSALAARARARLLGKSPMIGLSWASAMVRRSVMRQGLARCGNSQKGGWCREPDWSGWKWRSGKVKNKPPLTRRANSAHTCAARRPLPQGGEGNLGRAAERDALPGGDLARRNEGILDQKRSFEGPACFFRTHQGGRASLNRGHECGHGLAQRIAELKRLQRP